MEIARIQPPQTAIWASRDGKSPPPPASKPTSPSVEELRKLEQSLSSEASSLLDQAATLFEALGKALNEGEKLQACQEDGPLESFFKYWASLGSQGSSPTEEGIKKFVSPCVRNTRVECPPTR